MTNRTIRYYDEHAHILYTRYRSLTFEQVHARWLRLLPDEPGLALDVGAGPGRDAAALARRGWEVVAVEPTPTFRQLGAAALAQEAWGGRVRWLDDRLPELHHLERLDLAARFDLILVSAVWMHVPPSSRERAFRKLVHHLAPGGLLVFQVRLGPPPEGRGDHEVAPDELATLANQHAVERLPEEPPRDTLLDQPGVSWRTIVMRAPRDDSGALALLRHVILNDAKSSTYKLALLRTVARVADGSAGMVLQRDDEDRVHLPMGLVALTWLRLFYPLLQGDGFPQQPRGNGGLSFHKAPLQEMLRGEFSALDLHPGARFSGDRARLLMLALRDVRDTIRKMPAVYITFADGAPVFTTTVPHGFRPDRRRAFSLTPDDLAALGTFTVPGHIWDAMRRYACWIEPAINLEWARLMQSYHPGPASPARLGEALAALEWSEPEHRTGEARARCDALRATRPQHCVWTGRRLTDTYQIDHALPFARWPNNDLWNLLPATAQANASKADRVPSADLLDRARGRILDWWDRAWGDAAHEHSARFFAEARASLPLAHDAHDLEAIFEGVWTQRLRLRRDQRVPEWSPRA